MTLYPGYDLRPVSNCEVKTTDGYCLEPHILKKTPKKEGAEKIRGKGTIHILRNHL